METTLNLRSVNSQVALDDTVVTAIESKSELISVKGLCYVIIGQILAMDAILIALGTGC